MSKEAKPKGEPWKPKEKFDKKANKEQKQEQQKEQNKEQNKDQNKEQQKEQNKEQSENVQKDVKESVQKEQLKKEENKPQLMETRKDFTSHLQQFTKHSSNSIRLLHGQQNKIYHPQIIDIGIKYQDGSIMGSTYRCFEFLQAIKSFIRDYKVTKETINLGEEFNTSIEKVFRLLQSFRAANEGMKTAYVYIRYLLSLCLQKRIDENKLKQWLCEQIDVFIEGKIVNARDLIIQNAQSLIQNGQNILIFGRSHLVEEFLIQQSATKDFTVFIVDNPPFNEGRELMKSLVQNGLNVNYLLLSHVSYVLKSIDKIFVGASALLINGALISRAGTAFLACLANAHKIPFHVFCETYKFSEEKSQIDSLSWNELVASAGDQLSLRYDVTQSQFISMVVTEVGLIPATSVKTIIREFKQLNYVDQIQLP